MYAIVVSGGKQHRVSQGDLVRVEKIDGEIGSSVALDQVLMIGGDEPKIGTPTIDGARVTAEIVRQGREKKITIFKFKPNKNYRRKNGHRQLYTQLRITGIEVQ